MPQRLRPYRQKAFPAVRAPCVPGRARRRRFRPYGTVRSEPYGPEGVSGPCGQKAFPAVRALCVRTLRPRRRLRPLRHKAIMDLSLNCNGLPWGTASEEIRSQMVPGETVQSGCDRAELATEATESGRPEAWCRDCSRSVSPDLSPNPAVRRSTQRALWAAAGGGGGRLVGRRQVVVRSLIGRRHLVVRRLI
jgi:hypothetical protein